jgi:hypothetical protein
VTSRRRATAIALAALVASAGCQQRPPADTLPGRVLVRVGRIDADRLEAARADVPASAAEQVEDLFDLFWELGCAGEHLSRRPRVGAGHPDVVCRLPGRSDDIILVIAWLGGDGSDGGWADVASLPFLHRALALERRDHSFVFAGLGRPTRRSNRFRHAQGFGAVLGADAIVSLTDLGVESPILWSLSPDARLRDGFANVGLRLGRTPTSLRLLTPPAAAAAEMKRPPLVAIGRGTPGSRADPDVAASAGRLDFSGALRVVAIYLGYLDRVIVPAEPAPPGQSAADEPGPARHDPE